MSPLSLSCPSDADWQRPAVVLQLLQAARDDINQDQTHRKWIMFHGNGEMTSQPQADVFWGWGSQGSRCTEWQIHHGFLGQQEIWSLAQNHIQFMDSCSGTPDLRFLDLGMWWSVLNSVCALPVNAQMIQTCYKQKKYCERSLPNMFRKSVVSCFLICLFMISNGQDLSVSQLVAILSGSVVTTQAKASMSNTGMPPPPPMVHPPRLGSGEVTLQSFQHFVTAWIQSELLLLVICVVFVPFVLLVLLLVVVVVVVVVVGMAS